MVRESDAQKKRLIHQSTDDFASSALLPELQTTAPTNSARATPRRNDAAPFRFSAPVSQKYTFLPFYTDEEVMH